MVSEARKFMPDVRGAVITIHTNRAWEVKYPTGVRPFSHTARFDAEDPESSFRALKACLVWAWRAHKRNGGGDPHFDLGVVL